MKIETPGALLSSWATFLAPRWPKMRFRAHLDTCWGASWRQDEQSWAQDGAMLANLAPRCAQADKLGGYLASISVTFFVSWARSCQNVRKPGKRRWFITFKGFFRSWGCSWRLCWLILALFCAIWVPSWSNLATRCGLRAPRRAKIAAKSAKMRQDGENQRPEREVATFRRVAADACDRRGVPP